MVVRKKIIHYHQLYIDHSHREVSTLGNDILEESVTFDVFRFLRAACLANIKGSVGLILAKSSVMRIFIPLDLSSLLNLHQDSFTLGDLQHS